ncbi:MAG: hypothetical protein ABI040_06895 [Rhodoferax sp.]
MNSPCLAQIETMLADPTRKRCTLVDLLRQCHTTGMSHPCPIIKALVEPAAAG